MGFQNRSEERENDFGLIATNAALDESGIVEESATQRKLNIVTLPPKHWTVGLYRVTIVESDGVTTYEGPAPPSAAALETELNKIFGQQANVTFTVNPLVKQITLNMSQVTPPTYPAHVSDMKAALWAGAATDKDLALFWVPTFLPAHLAGEAFDSNCRGAVITELADLRTPVHEVGHCMGLFHCWEKRSHSSQRDIPDIEGKRLMEYGGGKFLRNKEIMHINQWTLPPNPLSGQ